MGLLLAADLLAAPRIGLVTMQPGQVYWSRFGHNAILVEPQAGEPVLYNYGYFDFNEPGFLLRFLQGEMEYRLVALPAAEDLAHYAAEGRGVSVQWLALDPERATELARFLRWNALPENARYRYDYFTRNCSTMVRDALDRALDGALHRQLRGRSRGLTYRSESLRLGAPEPWLLLGMHAGLGRWADRPLSRWEEGFVPMRLADAIGELEHGGSALVQQQVQVVPHRLAPTPQKRPSLLAGFAGSGVLLAVLLVLGLSRTNVHRAAAATAATTPALSTPTASATSAAPASAPTTARRRLRAAAALLATFLWGFAGIGGLLLAALWAFTDHQAAWRNENLLLFNPLCLLLLGAVPALWRGQPAPRWLARLGMAVLLGALVAVFLKFMPARVQDNLDWIALWLPLHAVLAWALARRSGAAG